MGRSVGFRGDRGDRGDRGEEGARPRGRRDRRRAARRERNGIAGASGSKRAIDVDRRTGRAAPFDLIRSGVVRTEPKRDDGELDAPRMKPFSQSASLILSSMMSTTMSSVTSAPESIASFASFPTLVPAATAARSMSPVLSCGVFSRFTIFGACVPFPAPGGPKRMMIVRFWSAAAVSAGWERHGPIFMNWSGGTRVDRCGGRRSLRRGPEHSIAGRHASASHPSDRVKNVDRVS